MLADITRKTEEDQGVIFLREVGGTQSADDNEPFSLVDILRHAPEL